MSSRGSQSRQPGSARITDEKVMVLVSRLKSLLPDGRGWGNDRVPPSQVLREACNHIRGLRRQVEDLSERLAELLAAEEMTDAQAEIIRSLLMP